MDALQTILRPVVSVINAQIGAKTPARELCGELDGAVIAVRVRETGLAAYFFVLPDQIDLAGTFDGEPDVVITGSLLSLASLAGESGEEAIRAGRVDLSGDADIAKKFQKLMRYGRPDLEEELSAVIGDVAAHGLGEAARSVGTWGVRARDTIARNVSEYLQEESRAVPSRYEADAFRSKVDALRDDVARFEVRLKRLES